MFDRPAAGNRALLVQIDFGHGLVAERLAELELLAGSAGAETVGVVQGKRAAPDARMFVGSGKAGEIGETAAALDADIVIFNHELSPGQQRNLESAFQRRVVDRTALILDIFALRARSFEGKLQVELAQLEHLATRLVRGWTHLERQKGGIGLRGPGETQLETDRRLLGNRVKLLKERLSKLERQRAVRRRARERSEVPLVSLVGYTNAGKSTLFNTLTKAGAYAADQLFATLDTTSRRVYLRESDRHVVLSDTVGFIRDLPHAVVAAFHATLEETARADLLLHVVDASSPDREAQIAVVNEVLREIGAGDVPQVMVWNKIDATAGQPGIDTFGYASAAAGGRGEPCDTIPRVLLSARTGDGIDLLRGLLQQQLFPFLAPAAAIDPDSDPDPTNETEAP